MADVVVTVPMSRWDEWIAEGDLPGDPWTGNVYDFYLYGPVPDIRQGERVYIVAHNRLRGYAPLVMVDFTADHDFSLVRHSGAVAVTIDEPIRGFRGWRYRWWPRAIEKPFPDWRTP